MNLRWNVGALQINTQRPYSTEPMSCGESYSVGRPCGVRRSHGWGQGAHGGSERSRGGRAAVASALALRRARLRRGLLQAASSWLLGEWPRADLEVSPIKAQWRRESPA